MHRSGRNDANSVSLTRIARGLFGLLFAGFMVGQVTHAFGAVAAGPSLAPAPVVAPALRPLAGPGY
jgi:hypothetical protein